MKSTSCTLFLFLLAFFLNLKFPPKEKQQQYAEQWTQEKVQKISDLHAFVTPENKATVLFFEKDGFQGPIHGAILIEKESVSRIILLKCNEGFVHSDFKFSKFLNAFDQKSIHSPIVVDAVSGASISSKIMTDTINQRLQQWSKYLEQSKKNPK